MPASGEVLLSLRVCGLCGTDLFKLASDSVPAGTVLGHEIVGIVEALGEGVEGLARGDRVVVPHHVACGRCELCEAGNETMCPVFRENLLEPGGFSERVLVRGRAVEVALRRIPDQIPDEAAAFLEPAACVLRGVLRSGLREGELAIVVGGGSMGLLHVLVLRALGHDRILAIDPLRDRQSLAMRLGASATAEPARSREVVSELSRDRGASVVFDTVGGAVVLESSLDLLRPGGTLVLFAHARIEELAGFDLNSLFKSEKRIIATYSGALREQIMTWELIASGRLDASPIVTHRMPLARLDEAVTLVRVRLALKVLLEPSIS
jgi:L-iditol 2-dehydrogenase